MMAELYCTVGRGMEPFCGAELRQLGASLQGRVEGKLFFSMPTTATAVPLLLRTAERVFVSAYHSTQSLDNSSRAIASFHLQRLLSEQICWAECISTWRCYHPQAPAGPLPFRINVRVSGKLRTLLQPIRIARSFAQRLCNYKDLLTPCLRNPLVAIDLHISDDHITAGISLSLTSQALGGPSHGLRSTTANAMAMCLHMDSGNEFTHTKLPVDSTVLDPMCGKGSLLYELPQYCLIGVDTDEKQLSFSKSNVPKALFILADARNLPLNSNCVDNIVCDIPFGVQYSTQSELEHLLPPVIEEMKRVVRPGGKVILLTSIEQLPLLETYIKLDWVLAKKFKLSLGLLESVISIYFVK